MFGPSPRSPKRPGSLAGLALAAGLLSSALGVGAGCSQDDTLRLSPAESRQSGGVAVRIHGSDFMGHGDVIVYLGTRAAKGVVVEGPRLIRLTTPQSETTGPMDVTLRFGDGTQRVITEGFRYVEQAGIVLQPRIGS